MSSRTLPFQLGDFGVVVTIDRPDAFKPGHAPHMELVAVCGETRKEGSITTAGAHDYSDEQFEKDIRERAEALAHEAAAAERARQLHEKFFKE